MITWALITWACQEHDHMSLSRTWSHELAKHLITWASRPRTWAHSYAHKHMWSTPFSSNFQLQYKLYKSQLNMNVSSYVIPEFFTCSLQVVLLITDIIILGVFLFFKMYHKFYIGCYYMNWLQKSIEHARTASSVQLAGCRKPLWRHLNSMSKYSIIHTAGFFEQ